MSSKKTTTETSTSTTTPTNPEWVTNGIQGQMGRINQLAGADPYSFIAGPSALQTQGFNLAGQIGANAAGQLNSASQIAQGLGSYVPQQVQAQRVGGASVDPTQAFASFGAADPTSALSALLSGQPNNPYLASMNQANINAALRGYNDATSQAARTLTQSVLPGLRSGAILSGQYGGSREGIAEGVAAGNVGQQLAQNARDLGIAAMDSGNQLYGNAYEGAQNRMAQTANGLAGMALQTAGDNANRDLQTQQSNASNALQAALANQSAGLQGANLNLNAAQYLGGLGQYGLNTLGQFGNTQQALDQQRAQAPLTLAQATNSMYGGMPLDLFKGGVATTNSKTVNSSSPGPSDWLQFAAQVAPYIL